MNRKGDKSLIVGLDIGTSKVSALVGEYSPGNPIEVIGIGSHESRGMRRGVVVDIESTVQSIQRAIEEAELMAGCEVRSVYASISGNHVPGRISQGSAPIRDGEGHYADLDRVLEEAKSVAIPAHQRIMPGEERRVSSSGMWVSRRRAIAIAPGPSGVFHSAAASSIAAGLADEKRGWIASASEIASSAAMPPGAPLSGTTARSVRLARSISAPARSPILRAARAPGPAMRRKAALIPRVGSALSSMSAARVCRGG